MRLKNYRAANMAEAMRMIRAELGPDALILANRRTGDGVEITAAIDNAPDEAPPTQPPADIAGSLAWHGVPAELAAFLTTGPLADMLARAFRFADPLENPEHPVLLVGAPGAGKTLSLVKLATRCVMRGGTPLVITADGKRAGATEQLAAFTRLLGIDLIVANSPATLVRALGRRLPGHPALIDAPGADPFDPAQANEIQALADAAGAEMLLAWPTGLDPAEAAEAGSAWREAGASLLLPTRLDLSRRMGGVLACAHAGRLAFTECGTGASAAEGLAPLGVAELADILATGKPVRANAQKEAA